MGSCDKLNTGLGQTCDVDGCGKKATVFVTDLVKSQSPVTGEWTYRAVVDHHSLCEEHDREPREFTVTELTRIASTPPHE